MTGQHDIAVDMIDARFEKLLAGNTSAQLHSETSMAIEMAHALGAIDINEHRHYVARQDRILQRQHEELMQKLESCRQ
ncbi:MAG: hypothetical protein GAK37_00310 [Pseudomonas sp.]|nr:MAG: hypothetical protein GAK37_00310 [Pseudomonas sp.]